MPSSLILSFSSAQGQQCPMKGTQPQSALPKCLPVTALLIGMEAVGGGSVEVTSPERLSVTSSSPGCPSSGSHRALLHQGTPSLSLALSGWTSLCVITTQALLRSFRCPVVKGQDVY